MSTRAFRVRIDVRLDSNVNDPQGNAVLGGLRSLGHHNVQGVRIGKIVELSLEAADVDEARARAEQMCQELLVNPVIETVEISVAEEV